MGVLHSDDIELFDVYYRIYESNGPHPSYAERFGEWANANPELAIHLLYQSDNMVSPSCIPIKKLMDDLFGHQVWQISTYFGVPERPTRILHIHPLAQLRNVDFLPPGSKEIKIEDLWFKNVMELRNDPLAYHKFLESRRETNHPYYEVLCINKPCK